MALEGRKRNLSSFNLSFLDIMFCGFGAVVLLVLIVNSQMVHHRKEQSQNIRQEVTRLETEVKAGQRLVSELKNSLEQTVSDIAAAERDSATLVKKIQQMRMQISSFANVSLVKRQAVEKLQSDLKSLDAERKRLLAAQKMGQDAGEKARHFSGQGHRQYLTGLRLGGNRVLFLIDTSASMLDSRIIDIIKRRNLSRKDRLFAPKWQRTIKTVRWLLANLPPTSSVRIILFNNGVKLLGSSNKGWVPIISKKQIDQMIAQLINTVPAHGTDLYSAFATAARLNPRPDNILLLTDGLPTIMPKSSGRGRVSSEQRIRLFRKAVARLPRNVPVNTILMPLEGDPMAAGLFWQLAVDTRGSFLTPSSDWP